MVIKKAEKGIPDYFELLSSLLTKLTYLITTPFYLRNAETGTGVVCQGKPSLLIQGRLKLPAMFASGQPSSKPVCQFSEAPN